MNISEEANFAESLVKEARKLNPKIGYFVGRIAPPLSGDLIVKLTNGTIKIGTIALLEFRRSGKNTPRTFIEDIAWSFELKAS
jgi:hypothetical protein